MQFAPAVVRLAPGEGEPALDVYDRIAIRLTAFTNLFLVMGTARNLRPGWVAGADDARGARVGLSR